jgi:putative flavoprotein involved in K+ transport
MHTTDVIIIGGGQAGLAMSRSLALRGVDHVVLERGRIGERWHSERWRSLHLLSTNAMSALPGLPYDGSDPDAFMPAGAFAAYLKRYAQTIASPVMSGVEATEVEPAAGGYRVSTTAGEWRSQAIVVATGACETPFRPAMAQALTARVAQLSPSYYWEPGQLPDGGVLVIGASSSGVQLAEEIHASGRPVTLAVGDHTRVPRRYRGRDIYAWMETAGILDDPALEGGNLDAARRQPSLQLVGRPDHRNLDLGILARLGVRLVGRLVAIDGERAEFADDLDRTTKASHVRMLRILDRIDGCIGDRGLEAPAADPAVRIPIQADGGAMPLDLWNEGIRSVVWATGYIRRYPWLKARVLNNRGEIVHRGGVTPLPGLYLIGLTFLRRRRSSFIDGCGLDAEDLAPIVKARLGQSSKEAA